MTLSEPAVYEIDAPRDQKRESGPIESGRPARPSREMLKPMSRVDVIVPCYNYGRFLRECVESIISQEGVDVRVLILDDASSDDTEAVCHMLAEQDSRIEFRRHGVNKGHIDTYNEGIEWLSGDYCVLISADDLLPPGSLCIAAKFLDEQPQVVMTYGRCLSFTHSDELAAKAQEPIRPSWRAIEGMAG